MILKLVKQIVNAIKEGAPEKKVQANIAALGNELLINAVRTNDTDAVNALLKQGVDPNALDTLGMTALTCAVMKNNTKVISILLSNGANVNGVEHTYLCKRPLGEAAEYNAVEAAQMLIDNGADLNLRDSHGRTPLMMAAENNALDVAGLLIQSGANLEAKGGFSYSSTALCFAVLAGHEEMTELLIKHNAKIKALNQVKKQIPPKMKRWLKEKGIIK
jgi:ankyrin repeat protein